MIAAENFFGVDKSDSNGKDEMGLCPVQNDKAFSAHLREIFSKGMKDEID
ncbi:hypothetical protein [Tunturiibacter gelidoferens]|uniref:Uncharacterized protein n=1 Tax=Tunturiibacter gelidiferens TaxID=3069689 RepID=A0ACC5NX74_9BACT|nr:hypothetical protein [Edaphobacter lichenicola]MBB5339188.1 hypothetical protein [Edaphobacter lichenicola]